MPGGGASAASVPPETLTFQTAGGFWDQRNWAFQRYWIVWGVWRTPVPKSCPESIVSELWLSVAKKGWEVSLKAGIAEVLERAPSFGSPVAWSVPKTANWDPARLGRASTSDQDPPATDGRSGERSCTDRLELVPQPIGTSEG